jgi:hypothetical protein
MHSCTLFRRLRNRNGCCNGSADTAEPLKEVCSNSRLSALRHFILFHLPAILVSTALLVLHLKNIRWHPPHPTADELAALQFAAKVQETLILVSLADILLHRVHYSLLGNAGIPLGFLSSPFQLGFSLRYLISREFWSATLSPAASRYSHTATAVVVFAFSLLGLAAGPSSAIAMLPRLDWWQLSTSATNAYLIRNWGVDERAQFVGLDPYAMKLDNRSIPGYKTCELAKKQDCINHDLSVILQTLEQIMPEGGDQVGQPTRVGNISTTSPPEPPHRQLTISLPEAEAPFDNIAYAVSPMAFVAEGFRRDFTQYLFQTRILIRSNALKLSGKELWKQPLVEVRCNMARMDHKSMKSKMSATFDFGGGLPHNFTVKIDPQNTPDLRKSMPTKPDDLAWYNEAVIPLDIQHLLPMPVSASIFFVPYLTNLGLTSRLCLVQARWVEAEVWLWPQESLEVQTQLRFPMGNATQYIQQTADIENTIKMEKEWLEGIGAPPGSTNASRKNPAYLKAFDYCDGEVLSSSCLPSFLAAYLANNLARTKDIEGDEQDSPTSPVPYSNSTVIDNTYFEHVYAYGFGAGTLIPFAFAILFLQVAIALVHLAIIVLARRPWHCSAWEDFGQLLTLALRSKAPEGLKNAGAGVKRWHTWRLMTVVREVGKDSQLEMVVDAPTVKPRRGQATADVEGQGNTEMRIPQVGVKYG